MKILWVLLNIGLVFGEKLDRSYLPPSGSSLSGGSPGAINLPLELPNIKTFIDGGFYERPELVIGINRVSPNQADDNIFEDLASKKPVISNNESPVKFSSIQASLSMQSSPFFEQEGILKYNEENTLPDFNNIQAIHNIENHPSISLIDDENRVYLPSYVDVYNTNNILSRTLPTPVNSEKYEEQDSIDSNNNKDTSLLNPIDQHLNDISSTILPNYSNDENIKMISPENPRILNTIQYSTMTPVNLNKENLGNVGRVDNQRPERIQAQSDRQATIVAYDQSVSPEGYAYSYDTSNGIHGDEEGSAVNGVHAKGSYSYIGDDGILYKLEYTADENGFVPKGTHLPTAPPIPDAILKVIEQAAKDKKAGIYDDGSYNEEKYGYKNHREKYPQTSNIDDKHLLIENEEESQLLEENEDFDENGIDKPKTIDSTKSNEYNNLIINKINQVPVLKSSYGVSISNGNNEDNTQTVPDYRNFPPEMLDSINKVNSFSTLLFGTNQELQAKTNNTEKVTAKPFLTPYVTRKYDDSDIKDFNDELGNENQDTDFNEHLISNGSGEIYEEDPNESGEQRYANKIKYQKKFKNMPNGELKNTGQEIDTREFISDDKPEPERKYEDRLNHFSDNVPTKENVYFYQNDRKPSFVTLNPRVSYTSSTTASNNFPSRGEIPISKTIQFIDNSTKNPDKFQTIRPGIVDYKLNAASPDSNIIFNQLSSHKTIQQTTSKPGYTGYSMQYRLNTESPEYTDGLINPDIKMGEDGRSEDFTGPKQPQRFDPITGYHY